MANGESAVGLSMARGQSVPEWVLPVVMIAGAAALQASKPVNADVAWILEGAERLLSGGRFGIDVVDVNPPLAWWIAMVPAAIVRATGLPVGTVAACFVAILGAASLAVSMLLLPIEAAGRAGRAGLALAGTYLLLIAPGYDYGEREHLMAILSLPYIMLRSRERNVPKAAAVAIGIAAGLGFCLKPYFLLVPLGIEVWRWATTRALFGWLAPETIGLGFFGLVYAAAIVLLAPSYLTEVLPGAVATYWTFNNPLPVVLTAALVQAAPGAVAVAIAVFTAKQRTRVPPQALALLVAGTMSLIGAVIQMKGWRYHLLPVMIFLSFGACVACLAPARRGTGRVKRALALAATLVAAFPGPVSSLWAPSSDDPTAVSVAQLADAFRRNAGPDGRVFGLITSPRDVHPAVLAAGVHWAAPFCCVYELPGLIRADEASPEDRPAIEAAVQAELQASLRILQTRKPSVIVVDDGVAKLGFAGRPFDYLTWLSRDAGWATEFRNYHDGGLIGRFRLLVRN